MFMTGLPRTLRLRGAGRAARENDGMQPLLSLVPNERTRADELPSNAAVAASLAERLEEATRQLALTRSLLAEKQRECAELASALAHDAHSDALTGLFNRRKFNDLCAAEIARSVRYGTPLALIMVDVDHFKNVNDLHGHLVGDRALVDVARVLAERMRATDALCRWGGEEFMILAPHLEQACAVQMADKLRGAIARADFGPAGRITCSFGVATLRPGDRAIDLILRADTCLYRAKRTGRNCVAREAEEAAPPAA
jgi:diguanylate cyclase (GGDEF)-like protein